ncbi:AfsR/SARP family transcriptional regulator [Amycolatopsis oliviviridis]|uniref:AfsR/SARP family transcriptional regulator n=1 Tax=Amycolatopsis oliviviridis TaxID=1471590 RepID=UPI001748E147|nr:AfsR/SARP family transcriptional regulator [Amycolatopsis oliviviridis]
MTDVEKITAAKLRQVIALLAANANAVVSTEQLIDELWPAEPPRTVRTILQTYIYQLRKLFAGGSANENGSELLGTRPGGYVLALPRTKIDIFRFQHLADSGKEALARNEPELAGHLLRDALGLWRGPVLADVDHGPRLRGLSVYLEEQRLEALTLRIEAYLASGRHRETIGELRYLVAHHELHESFYILLMRALHGSGRRAEALEVFGELRRVLDEELGLEPSFEAKRFQAEILTGSRATACSTP